MMPRKGDYVVGGLRSKVWRLLAPPTSEDDPVWAERCKRYWARQEELRGLRFHDNVTMNYDPATRTLATFAVVKAVLQ